MDNEQSLFWQAMSDVKPLAKNDKVATSGPTAVTEAQLARRAAAQAQSQQADDQLTLDAVEPIDPDEIIGWTRGGMQHGVYKNLRLGHYSIDARLDLHGLTVEQSRQALLQFIADCQRTDVRSAIVLHGKGLNSKPFRGVLKSYVAKWLPCIPEVLAFHSAQPHHGGTGAVYVLMKKSPKAKLENRELNRKR
ncbi:DNA endonuclease SmrA [Ferrimonas senticii]|uniref:DNA endonuclease SmrA n=1 Tax=Ferrimonas senticii TaxID=394566 RepID=UPI000406AFFE|nr:DNA endonuclease SmrA [Ferrimonas senticii]